ncbi:MAG: gfo/Idh/MocA family oxidoreductase [Bacteroidetes bacterium]|nr:MAG: gfo/Idh/MocA family oxidoreductase [Bacteroidota bacterium]
MTWASIGCGNVCEVKSLPAMYKLPGSSVAGVYGRQQENAANFARRHAIPTVYTSVTQLLADPNVDIVYVSTPPHTHLQYTMAALDAGKHVYVEKPMGLNYAECVAMHQHAQLRQKKLFVAHYRRALPYFLQVQSLLQQGAIGRVITAHWQLFQPPYPHDGSAQPLPWRLQASLAGGGYFFDLAPHGLDILQFLLDDDIANAQGFSTNRGGLYGVEDTVAGSFVTQKGVCGTAHFSFVTTPEAKTDTLTFIGTSGQITCSVFAFTPIVLSQSSHTQEFKIEKPQHIQMPLVQTILNDLRGQGICPSHSSTALPTALAMDAMVGSTTQPL